MITWMQKHKKYLIITIWISVIAFVGAGSVAWGTLDFNKNRATSIAKIGNRNISYQKFQNAYNDAYNYYYQLSQGKFTQEDAQNMHLDNIVLSNLLKEELLLNYADDLGLTVTNNELAEVIANDEKFKSNGVFSQEQYKKTLQSLRISAKEYEIKLKDMLLLNKLLNAIQVKTKDIDTEILQAAFFIQDKLNAKVISVNPDSININEEELKKFWENSKENYLIPMKYVLETKQVSVINQDTNETELKDFYEENKGKYLNSEDKILSYDEAINDVKKDYLLKLTKKTALNEYLKIKKGESNTTSLMTIAQDDVKFPLHELQGAKIGDLLKPFEYENGFLIVRVKDIIKPEPMNFELAKNQVEKKFKEQKSKEILETQAKEIVDSNFTGTYTDFISKDSQETILGLSNAEFNDFIDKLFHSNARKNYVILNNKAIIYEILEQKLLSDDKAEQFKELLTQNAMILKNEEMQLGLLSALQKRYAFKQYIKGNASGN